MAAESNLKTLFDTRPLKQEAWLKCKDNLDHTQMSGLETIVEGKSLPNGFKRVHLEQVIRFMINELKWRQEKDPSNALNVTENFTINDDEAEFSPSQEVEFFKESNDPKNSAENSVAQDATKDSSKNADKPSQNASVSDKPCNQDSAEHLAAANVTTIPEEEKDDPLGMTRYEDSLNLSVIPVDKSSEECAPKSKPFRCKNCDDRFESENALKIKI